jgi:isoleucyl-tRNA synthetase
LIYEGYKVLPYCPRCGTPLSSHEVSLGYDEVSDPSVYVKMKIKGQDNTYFLIWTTTPWTLISNVALAVHPDFDYVKIKHNNQNLILAKERLSVIDGEYEILEEFKGSQLEKIEYERLFDFSPVDKKAFYVTLADFVTIEDGTGIVHMAPAFGEDDYNVSRKYDLPVLRPVDGEGKFTDEITLFKKRFVKDADVDIIKNLKQREILYRSEKIVHSYPHCWRCKSPLLYYARESWYIKTTAYRENLLARNKEINWYPKEVGEGRFGEWLKNNIDWALSRDRFWGTPLNIWECENCGEKDSVGSMAELKQRGKNVPENLDLHKPYIDEILISCQKCGKDMKRVPEVIDCWFDSGSMPYAQWHYPFRNKEKFEKNFPGDFISEGVDQTRGWFYSLLAISTLLFDKPAYKNVVSLELILDKEGQKMSKSKGNVVDPFKMMSKFGADILRWYLLTSSPPWIPKRFDEEGLLEVQRKFFGTLVNVYSFFVLYANIDKFEVSGLEKLIPISERPELDRWILSLLNTVIGKVRKDMETYEATKATRAISDFVIEDVSNWYVRRSRRRFWKSGEEQDKISAYQTLYEILTKVSKLVAPFAPFLVDEIFKNLKSDKDKMSVHLSLYPEVNESAIDKALEEKMDIARKVVTMSLALRNRVQIKVRQPLSKIIISVDGKNQKSAIEQMKNVILEEINVKDMEFTGDVNQLVRKKVKPNFKGLGPKFGKHVNIVADILKSFTQAEIENLEKNGFEKIVFEGKESRVELQDVEILKEEIPGLVVESENNVVVALDTNLTDELIAEGFAREFVNKVQNIRKKSGFEVTDRINIFYDGSEKLKKALSSQTEYIKKETLAIEMIPQIKIDDINHKTEVDINGEIAKIRIVKISK